MAGTGPYSHCHECGDTVESRDPDEVAEIVRAAIAASKGN
jgi:hypothetical protein